MTATQTRRYNDDVAKKALNLALPFILNLMETGTIKRKDLAIVIGNSEGEVLLSHNIGDMAKWEFPFANIARSKFDMTVRTGIPSRRIQSEYPELCGVEGDTFYWGSDIDGGIVVACSGVEPWWDEAISKVLIASIRAILTGIREEEMKGGEHFR